MLGGTAIKTPTRIIIIVAIVILSAFAAMEIISYYNVNFRTFYLAKSKMDQQEWKNRTGNPYYNLTAEDLDKWPVLRKALNEIAESGKESVTHTIPTKEADAMQDYFYERTGGEFGFEFNGKFYIMMFPI